MSRWVVLALSLAACSKSAAPQSDTGSKSVESSGGQLTGNAPEMGGPKAIMNVAPGGKPTAAGDSQRLSPTEGTLAINVPADAKAGAEVVATIVVTPGEGYHVNKEFPTKITMAKIDGVTFAKDQLIAGGADATKGDADTMEESKLAFSVKMTPTAGTHTVTGTFKFAVCDKDTCLPKKETISIQVAAK
jgi:hypothetical protein